MKEKWKIILKCAAFPLILAGLIGLLNPVFEGRMYDEVAKVTNDYRGVYAERENSLDVLFLGDSECYCAVSPMELWRDQGLASHCVSASGKNIQDIYEYFESVLDYQSPSLVFLEMNCIFTKVSLEDMIRSELRIAVPAAANHDTWRRIPVLDPDAEPPALQLDDTKGYYFRPLVSAWTGSGYMAPSEEVAPITPLCRGALDRLVKLCGEKGIELVLLSVPSVAQGSWPRHNAIQAYADEKGLLYLDLNLETEEMGIDWAVHTRDGGDHLNHAGAVRVTARLGRWLSENRNLPDHRGDPDFAQWDVSLENYTAIVEENNQNWKRALRDPEPAA